MARKQNNRSLRNTRPIVIGAGITEQCYFKHLKQIHNYPVILQPRFFGSDQANIMDKLVGDILSAGGTVICVYDLDVTRNNEIEKHRIDDFQQKYQNNDNVILCSSMPSIEYWFLLHYENINRYFASSNKVIEALKKHTAFNKHLDWLEKPNWVEEIDQHTHEAVKRAKAFAEEGSSYTYVWRAIEFLNNLVEK